MRRLLYVKCQLTRAERRRPAMMIPQCLWTSVDVFCLRKFEKISGTFGKNARSSSAAAILVVFALLYTPRPLSDNLLGLDRQVFCLCDKISSQWRRSRPYSGRAEFNWSPTILLGARARLCRVYLQKSGTWFHIRIAMLTLRSMPQCQCR